MNKREWMLQAALAALNGGFGPIDANELGALYDAICAASPEMAHEGAWVEHDGDVSKAPPAGSTTEVMFRDGSTDTGRSGEAAWDWCDDDMDIMRWRYA